MRALARALISVLVWKTTGYLSISAPRDNAGVPRPVGCLATGGRGAGLNISNINSGNVKMPPSHSNPIRYFA